MKHFKRCYVFVGFIFLLLFLQEHNIENECEESFVLDFNTMNDTIDWFFEKYETKSQLYLNRSIFDGTPLTGSLLSNCARNTYEETGVIVPLELALAQAQWETGMGRYGRSPYCNPFNVGEYDDRTVLMFESTEHGVQYYYDLMARDYLCEKTTEELLKNFTNTYGNRYASARNYEKSVGQTYRNIKVWIFKNL